MTNSALRLLVASALVGALAFGCKDGGRMAEVQGQGSDAPEAELASLSQDQLISALRLLPTEVLPEKLAAMPEAEVRHKLFDPTESGQTDFGWSDERNLGWEDDSDTENGCVDAISMHFFKYSGEDKYLVIYDETAGCDSSTLKQDRTYVYDIPAGTMKEAKRPIDKPSFGDFYDALVLATFPAENVQSAKEAFQVSPNWGDNFVTLHAYTGQEGLDSCAGALAYVWDGRKFVRRPSRDTRPMALGINNFGGWEISGPMPGAVKGYDLREEEEGGKKICKVISKDGQDILRLDYGEPSAEDPMEDTIGAITLYSDKYSGWSGGAGDDISEIIRNSQGVITDDLNGYVNVSAGGYTFFVSDSDLKADEIPNAAYEDPEFDQASVFKDGAKAVAVRPGSE